MELRTIIDRGGGAVKMAEALGIHRTTVLTWRGRVPPHHVAAIAKLTGLTKHQIRPDLWERETNPAADSCPRQQAAPKPEAA